MRETRTRPDWTVHTGNVVALPPRPAPPVIAETSGLVEAGLDALCQGVAILAIDGTMLQANATLRGYAALNDGLALTERGLCSTDLSVQSRLSDTVWVALNAAAGRGHVRVMPGGARIALPRRSGGAPWQVRVVPLRPGAAGGAAGAMLLVTDPRRRRLPGVMHLCELLGLSESQAELALALADGVEIAGLARRRGVTPAVLRRQIAALRRRTGCRTTAQVIGLVLTLA